jgi:adenylylsulfate kinase-like enzyme
VEPNGEFVLVYVKCSVEEAKRRDPKGLYEQALEGKVENFTGINHPFQEPHSPEIIVDTERQTESESVNHVLQRLAELGVLEESTSEDYGFEMAPSEVDSVRERLTDLGYLSDSSESG